jgi:hypothetical protein
LKNGTVSVSTRSPAAVGDEGRHARDRGDPITANRYPDSSDGHRIWLRGYEISDKEAGEHSTGDGAVAGDRANWS